jgi:hypothetical protein
LALLAALVQQQEQRRSLLLFAMVAKLPLAQKLPSKQLFADLAREALVSADYRAFSCQLMLHVKVV